MAGKDQDITKFFTSSAPPKRPHYTDEDDSGQHIPLPSTKAHVLLPPSPSRQRKALFTATSKLQRDSSPSFSSSPLSDPPQDLPSDGLTTDPEETWKISGSDTSPETATINGVGLAQKGSKTNVRVIKNSEDDLSSESSLEDLDTLFKSFTKPRPVPVPVGNDGDAIRVDMSGVMKHPPQKKPRQSKFEKGSQLRLKGHPTSARPRYSFSLGALIARTEREDADEMGVAIAKSLIDSSSGVGQRICPQSRADDSTNQALLTSVVKGSDDGGGMQRVLDAMKRTEAFNQEKTWSFFEEDGNSVKDYGNFIDCAYDFPTYSLRPNGWEKNLIDSQTRNRVFLSGIVAEKAASGKVPVELLQWIFKRVSVEPKEELRLTYTKILAVRIRRQDVQMDL
jgi:hypothetical protein